MARRKRRGKRREFGISIEPTWRIHDSLRLAKLAEQLGFSNIWVPDSGPSTPYSDALVTLSAIAATTSKIKFGSAILNFYTRNPALIASSFLALSDLGYTRPGTAQRAILGIGAGSAYNVAKIGVRNRSGVVEDLREAIESIRELFDGKQVTVRTDSFAIEGVSLSKAKKPIPIHVGATGPKSLRLAGEVADGVILTDRIASDIEQSMKPITLGIIEGSRSRSDIEITNSVVISVDENRQRAKNAARTSCAYLVAWIPDERVLELGFDPRSTRKIAELISAGDESSAARLVDDKMIATLTISGTPDECIEKCEEHLQYGIDQLAFCEPFGPNASRSIAMIGRKIIPKL